MENNLIKIIAIILVTGLLGLLLYAVVEEPADLLPRRSLEINNPSFSANDNEGNIYIIDSFNKRLIAMDNKQRIKFKITAREKGAFPFTNKNSGNMYFSEVAIDGQGNVFVLARNKDGFNVTSESILWYNSSGKKIGTLFNMEYNENGPGSDGYYQGLQCRESFVYFFEVNEDSIKLIRFALGEEQAETMMEVLLPIGLYPTVVRGSEDGDIFFATRKGELFRADRQGEVEMIYPAYFGGYSPGRSATGSVNIPISLDIDPRSGTPYFVDIGTEEIIRIGTNMSPTTIIKGNLVIGDGDEEFYSDESSSESSLNDPPLKEIDAESLHNTKHLKTTGEGSLILTTGNKIYFISPDGSIEDTVSRAKISFYHLAYQVALLVIVLFMAFLVLMALKAIHSKIRKQKLSLITRQLIFLIPPCMAAMIILYWYIYIDFNNEFENKIYDQLGGLAHMSSLVLDAGSIQNINGPKDYMSNDYRRLKDQSKEMIEGNQWLNMGDFQNVLYKVDNDQIFLLMSNYQDTVIYYPVKMNAGLREVVERGKIVTGRRVSDGIEWLFAMGPVTNQQGNTVGVTSIMTDAGELRQNAQCLFWKANGLIVGVTVALAIILALLSFMLLRTVGSLRDGVKRIKEGDFDTQINVNTSDELGELANDFNKMAHHLHNYLGQVTSLSKSYFRFVPQEFLTFLKKDSILDVELGNNVNVETNILVCSMHGFEQHTLTMTSDEKVKFINSLLERFAPVIRSNRGLMDKYLESGFTAYFPGVAGDAIKGAVELQKVLGTYNKEVSDKGNKPINMGIAIHRGPVLIGIIGEEKKLEGVVISGSVNTAISLEKMTIKLGATTIVTSAVINNLPSGTINGFRYLGMVDLEDGNKPEELYDVFENDPEITRKLKQETRHTFEEGIKMYQEGRFFEGRRKFLEVLEYNREDYAAKKYFFLCDDYFRNGAPETWNRTISA